MTLTQRASQAALLALLLAGCGGADVPTSTDQPRDIASAPTSDSTASASASLSASAAPASSETPADAHARKALQSIKEGGDDELFVGRLASFALSENVHELPAPMKKALSAVVSEGIDPGQRARIAGFMCSEPDVAPTVEKLCGKSYDAVNAELKKVPVAQRSAKLSEVCKLTVLPSKAALAKIDARGLLAANAVAAVLIARSAAPSELELAALVPKVFALDPATDW